MKLPVNPCKKDCENRSSVCHSECALYQSYRKDKDMYNSERLKYLKKDGDYYGYRKDLFEKRRRYRHWQGR